MAGSGNAVGGENPPEFFTEPCSKCGRKIRVSRESFQGHAAHTKAGIVYSAWHIRCPKQ